MSYQLTFNKDISLYKPYENSSQSVIHTTLISLYCHNKFYIENLMITVKYGTSLWKFPL
jgi:hypothetical protein